MGVIDRREKLLESIVRLRRAEREAPHVRDIVSVRAALEEELGPTVSLRQAARLLGMSHTALSRWLKTGDLPTIYTSSGRMELPVAALVDLYEAVTAERESGRRTRHLLEPTMSAGHTRARQLKTQDLAGDTDGHSRAERRGLAYHRAVARQLRRPMVDDALHTVWKWRDQGKIDPRYAKQWEDVLRKPVNEVRRLISEDSQFARDLRQNSPFAGMLSEAERAKIMRQVR